MKPPPAARPGGRNATLDGIRGLLALDVFFGHIALDHGLVSFPFNTGMYAVWGFFALSACVLVPSWDGRFAAFLARRFVRLWPMYALGLAIGGYLGHFPVPKGLFLFWPCTNMAPDADGPAWSLTVEAWAMLFMPILAWANTGSLKRRTLWTLVLTVLCFPLAEWVDGLFILGVCFIAGAWASQFPIRIRLFEGWLPQWLGRISYPLYLSHRITLAHAPGPLLLRVVEVFLVAQILTWTVERWSVVASRRVGRLHFWSGGRGPGAKDPKPS